MKINKLGSAKLLLPPERDGAVRTDKSDGQFALNLNRAQNDQVQQRLTQLIEAITAQGKRLASVPTYSELKAYREMVREFLGETVGRMYTLQSRTGWDRQGRQKLYTTIKQIDEQLAGLTEDIRCGQERQLAIMAKLDAIRGMLVDLYT